MKENNVYTIKDLTIVQNLVKLEVWTVSFSEYNIIIRFKDVAWIQIDSGYHFTHRGQEEVVSQFPLMQSMLMAIVGCVIERAELQGPNLVVCFSNKATLLVRGDSAQHECYRIFDGKHEIIV